MLFSVIIPVHNAEQYIDRCLQSIFVNDFEDYEILAVENGSTDNSLAILNSYASEHPQIKVFSTSEKGVSNARNIGLDNATGDIITFVDIDDTVSENYFFEICALALLVAKHQGQLYDLATNNYAKYFIHEALFVIGIIAYIQAISFWIVVPIFHR